MARHLAVNYGILPFYVEFYGQNLAISTEPKVGNKRITKVLWNKVTFLHLPKSYLGKRQQWWLNNVLLFDPDVRVSSKFERSKQGEFCLFTFDARMTSENGKSNFEILKLTKTFKSRIIIFTRTKLKFMLGYFSFRWIFLYKLPTYNTRFYWKAKKPASCGHQWAMQVTFIDLQTMRRL